MAVASGQVLPAGPHLHDEGTAVALDPRPHVICRPQPDPLRAEQRESGIAIAAAMLDDDTHPAFYHRSAAQ